MALLIATVASLLVPDTATARGVDGDLRLGVYSDASEAFVGGGLLVGMAPGSKWFFNPNLEYVFLDRGELVTINADFHYDLASDGAADFWLGAGAALVLRQFNPPGRAPESDETDFGVNLFGGVGFLRTSVVRPFLQAKLLLSDESEGVIAFGIRF